MANNNEDQVHLTYHHVRAIARQVDLVEKHEAIVGCLLGTAVGDALGLPYEGLAPGRGRRILGEPERHRFFFGRGMVSDDTEHAIMVLRALIRSRLEPAGLARSLASQLRFWLLGFPAGVGLATSRAVLKLCVGFPPHRSGVFSAGNGPSMRAPLLGVVARDTGHLTDLVEAATRITHIDPKAYYGAVAVALASHGQGPLDVGAYCSALAAAIGAEGSEFLQLANKARRSFEAGDSTEVFAQSLGLSKGVTGYTYHTVPVCLHACFRHGPDFASALREVIRCGGDADTTAAIVGGILGARWGVEPIPEAWLDGLWEWPWTRARLEKFASALGATVEGSAVSCPRYGFVPRVPRNLLFLVVILVHGFRRLFPPY